MKQILLFGADWCNACHQLRTLLDKAKLPYLYYDVDVTDEVILKMYSIMSLPVTIITDEHPNRGVILQKFVGTTSIAKIKQSL